MHVTRLFCPPLNPACGGTSCSPTPETRTADPPACGGDWRGASGLPAGARRLDVGRIIIRPSKSAADAARTLAETGSPLVVQPGAAMRPHAWWMDANALRAYRHTMETVNRHLETMGGERLPRGANAGFERKVP